MKNPLIKTLLFLVVIGATVACKTSYQQVQQTDDQYNQAVEVTDTDPLYEVEERQVYRASYTRKHDLIHTKLEVRFDWQKEYLHGLATLELKPYFYPQKTLVLDAKGFDIHEVAMLDGDDKRPLTYDYDALKITIDLGRAYSRDEHYLVQIKYTAKPAERESGGSQAISSDRGLYFINPDGSDPNKPRQIWTQGETEANSCWFPTIDAPNERTTQEMYITIEENFTTLSNGELIYSQNNGDGTKTDYWKMDLPHAPYLFMMAIGEYAVVKDQWRDMEVNYYVEPEFEPYAKAIFGITPEMLAFFSDILGYDYPWQKYSQVIVRDYVSGAMENTSASTFLEEMQMDDRELLDNSWDFIIAHELFHQWFGDLVTCESWANIPLNESFANYGEYLWKEYKYGLKEADYDALGEMEGYLNEAKSKQVDMIRFYYEDKEDVFDAHSYNKGGRILHMLRKHIGDDAFFKSLNLYLKENAFSAVEIHDLRLAFEKVTGKDLNWFFNQWFLASGHPQIRVAHSFSEGKVVLEVWQEQDPETTPVYQLPLYVDIWINREKKRFPIFIEKKYERFEFEVAQKPDLVLFDGEQQLLAEITHPKSTAELGFQYRHGDKFLMQHNALVALAQDSSDTWVPIAIAALDDPFWGIREDAVVLFENYEGPEKSNIEEKLARMALEDEKSSVRTEAVEVLSTLNPGKYTEVYKKALEDDSYEVIATALLAYTKTGAEDASEVFNRFADSDKADIVMALAEYYHENDINNKTDWFIEKLNHMSRGDLYYMLQSFGTYVIKAPTDDKMKSIKLFEEIARNHSIFYIRLAAFNALNVLIEEEGVAEMVQSIKDNEQDKRLLRIYSNM